jgi:hypothetical protein
MAGLTFRAVPVLADQRDDGASYTKHLTFPSWPTLDVSTPSAIDASMAIETVKPILNAPPFHFHQLLEPRWCDGLGGHGSRPLPHVGIDRHSLEFSVTRSGGPARGLISIHLTNIPSQRR